MKKQLPAPKAQLLLSGLVRNLRKATREDIAFALWGVAPPFRLLSGLLGKLATAKPQDFFYAPWVEGRL